MNTALAVAAGVVLGAGGVVAVLWVWLVRNVHCTRR